MIHVDVQVRQLWPFKGSAVLFDAARLKPMPDKLSCFKLVPAMTAQSIVNFKNKDHTPKESVATERV
jgi:hypothetical protein